MTKHRTAQRRCAGRRVFYRLMVINSTVSAILVAFDID